MSESSAGGALLGGLRRARPLFGLALFGVALALLHRQLAAHSVAELRSGIAAIPIPALVGGFGLTLLSYLTLTGFDALAIRHLGRHLAYGRVAVTAFIAAVFSFDLGLNLVGSSAIRYRLYSAWGLGFAEVGMVVAFTALTFLLGVLALGGVLFAAFPLALPAAVWLPLETTRPIGVALLLGLLGYLALALRRREPLAFHGAQLPLPGASMTAAQIGLASLDWVLAASVLWVLLPVEGRVDLPSFVAIFMTAQLLAVASTVPAGLGVFEGLMVALLSAHHPVPHVLGALLVYRVLYYLLPIFAAVGALGCIEAMRHRTVLGRGWAAAAAVGSGVAPRAIAMAVLVSGLLVLASAAAPPAAWHATALGPLLPQPLLGLSHGLGAVTGIALVLLSGGLQRRVDAAWSATLGVLAVAAPAALLAGAHWLLGGALALAALSLWACRARFDRPAALLAGRLPGPWSGLVAFALAGIAWLGVWSNALHRGGEALDAVHGARPLRAAGLVVASLALLVVWRGTRPARPAPRPAGPEELERAARIARAAPRSDVHLALLGDKCLLFDDEDENALLMYGVSGRSWVAMGDPAGRAERRRALAWRFRELTDRHAAWPVFYEVGPEDLPTYLDLGLSLHKLGESARVPLAGFSLEGSARRGLRQAVRRCEREGAAFEVLPSQAVAPLLPELESISDAWLAAKHTREKGFSLGAFERSYLPRHPVGLVRVAGRPVAFANLWLGAPGSELGPDLMRYDPASAPPGVMEYLFAKLMLHGAEAGYAWFALGMAPLSGLPASPLSPLWNRVGSALYRHGEHFYNFQGLRRYKEKFHPEWEPRYLASPGPLATPRVLANVAALVSGGLRGVVSR